MSTNTPDTIDPQTGFTPTHDGDDASVAQAARDLRHAAEEKVRDALHLAREKSSVIKERATESAKHLYETAGEKASALKESATTHAKHLRENAAEQWDHTRDKAKEIQVSAEDYIRQNPTKCVLSALGVGFLIGLLVRR